MDDRGSGAMWNGMRTATLIAAMAGAAGGAGAALTGRAGLLVGLALAAAAGAFVVWRADRIVLGLFRAQEVDERSAPYFVALVRELAGRAGLPMPRVALVDEDAPNAFATGRDPSRATVAATTGSLRLLSPGELRGMLAHELAHVARRDILSQSVAAAIAAGVVAASRVALPLGRRDAAGRPAGSVGLALHALLSSASALLVQLSRSRRREFEADRLGARIADDAQGLASALLRIRRYAEDMPIQALERHPETAPMLTVNPLPGVGLHVLYRTHPSVDDRVDRLLRMERPAMAGAGG